jgi:hypothetical protein
VLTVHVSVQCSFSLTPLVVRVYGKIQPYSVHFADRGMFSNLRFGFRFYIIVWNFGIQPITRSFELSDGMERVRVVAVVLRIFWYLKHFPNMFDTRQIQRQ